MTACVKHDFEFFFCIFSKNSLQVSRKCLPLHPQQVRNAEIAQLVEHNLAKVGVASPSLVFRSNEFFDS